MSDERERDLAEAMGLSHTYRSSSSIEWEELLQSASLYAATYDALIRQYPEVLEEIERVVRVDFSTSRYKYE